MFSKEVFTCFEFLYNLVIICHFVNVDKMKVDEMEIDKMGIDKMGIRSGNNSKLCPCASDNAKKDTKHCTVFQNRFGHSRTGRITGYGP